MPLFEEQPNGTVELPQITFGSHRQPPGGRLQRLVGLYRLPERLRSFSKEQDLRKTLLVREGLGELRSPKGVNAPFTPTKSKIFA
jgi:hypothetical protein